jgi:hypothetical protein
MKKTTQTLQGEIVDRLFFIQESLDYQKDIFHCRNQYMLAD